MSVWTARIVICASLLVASTTSAAVTSGDLRAFIDTDLANFERTRIEKVGAREFETQIDLGPGGSAITASLPGLVGLGFGYVLTPQLVGSLHFSLARHQSSHQRYFDGGVQPTLHEPTTTAVMLRPELEWLFNPKSVAVFGVLVGGDFRKWNERSEPSSTAPARERQSIAFGPALGLVSHLFVLSEASVDVALLSVADFVRTQGDDPWVNAPRYLNFGLSLTLGVSLWP